MDKTINSNRKLALAHYSLRLSSVFIFELCFGFLLHDHFKIKQSEEPYLLKDLSERGMILADIFRSEHILTDKMDHVAFQKRIEFLAEDKLFDLDKEAQSIK